MAYVISCPAVFRRQGWRPVVGLLTERDIGIMASGLKCLTLVELRVLFLVSWGEGMAAVILRRERQYFLWN